MGVSSEPASGISHVPLSPPAGAEEASAPGAGVRLPRISLVIPNYNAGEAFERAFRSVLDQKYPNLQIIVSDAGSTDASRDAIERYREHIDVLFSEKDNGQADGLNKGFRAADGEVHGWLCSDDELMPGALLHAGELLANNPEVGVITGGCERCFPDGVSFVVPGRADAWDRIGIQNIIEQPATFWRAQVHHGLGELDESYHLGFDWDLWGRMRDAGVKLLATERTMARYHFSDTNKSGNAGALFEEEAYRLVKAYGPMSGRLADIYRFIYRHFDRKGCLDKPRTSGAVRTGAFFATMAVLRVMIGEDLLRSYNWHFAVQQERGEKWWV